MTQRRFTIVSPKRFILCTILIAAAALAGCNRGGNGNGSAELANLKPNEVLDRYFSAIQTDQIDALPMFFAADVDKGILTKYIKKMNETTELDRYAIPPNVNDKGMSTTVKGVKYRYRKKKIDKYGVEHIYDSVTVNTDVLMVKENGVWKIRNIDPELSRPVERVLFMNCKKNIHEARLALAKYYNANNKTYPQRIGDLKDYLVGFSPDACSVLKIEVKRAGKIDTDYRLTAVTRNVPECTIWATDEKIFPEAYDRCPRD